MTGKDKPRKVIVERTNFVTPDGDSLGRTRALSHDPAKHAVVLCLYCKEEGTAPLSAVLEGAVCDDQGRVIAVCPHCRKTLTPEQIRAVMGGGE